MQILRKFLYIASISIKTKLIYLKDFIISRIFLVIVIIIFSFVYKTLLASNENFASFTVVMLLYYLSITESIEMSRVAIHATISNEIKDGSVAYQLTRPISFVLYHFSSCMGEIFLKHYVTLFIGLVTAFIISDFKIIPVWQLLVSLPIIWGAIILNLLFMIFIGMFAFYIEETRPVYWIYQKFVFILGGLFVPLDFSPSWVLRVIKYFPFTYMNYFAGKMVVKFNIAEYFQGFGIQLVYIIFLFVSIQFLYKRGIKKISIQGG